MIHTDVVKEISTFIFLNAVVQYVCGFSWVHMVLPDRGHAHVLGFNEVCSRVEYA